jgi:hypothetical protein
MMLHITQHGYHIKPTLNVSDIASSYQSASTAIIYQIGAPK